MLLLLLLLLSLLLGLVLRLGLGLGPTEGLAGVSKAREGGKEGS